MAKPEKTEVPTPDPVQDLEREKYEQRLRELLAVVVLARSYLTTIRLGLEASRLYVPAGTLNYAAAIHRVAVDIEAWIEKEEIRLSQPIDQETLH